MSGAFDIKPPKARHVETLNLRVGIELLPDEFSNTLRVSSLVGSHPKRQKAFAGAVASSVAKSANAMNLDLVMANAFSVAGGLMNKCGGVHVGSLLCDSLLHARGFLANLRGGRNRRRRRKGPGFRQGSRTGAQINA